MACISKNLETEISQTLGYVEGSLPFKNQGVPLYTKKLTIAQFMSLVEKFSTKIRCWVSRLLSYSSRLQLVKTVLFGMQISWAWIIILPKTVAKLLKATYRTFLWTGQDEL